MDVKLGLFLNKEVKFFPYRKAQIASVILSVTPSDEEYDVLLEHMCRRAKVQPDNHICFLVDDIGISFSDGSITVGKLVEKEW